MYTSNPRRSGSRSQPGLHGIRPGDDSLCRLLINDNVQPASWLSNSGGSTAIHPYGRCEDDGSIYVRTFINMLKLKKTKVITLQSWTGLVGFRRLKLPEVLDNRHMKVTRISALSTGCF